MASLIEGLINVLEEENNKYEELLELSLDKTSIIVKGDLEALNTMIEREQQVVDAITPLEKKRTEISNDIALVLGQRADTFNLNKLEEMIASQPRECQMLKDVHSRLKSTLAQMVRVNENNKQLLTDSIDILEFEMNLAQSLRQGPSTANYSGSTYADDSYMARGSFDAKQ